MIKHCLIILTIWWSSGLLAQSYEPMMGDSNIWYTLDEEWGYWTEPYCAHEEVTIKGEVYKILRYCDGGYPISYLREDTVAKKVYSLPPRSKDSSEVIYCDFSLENGDSVYLHDIYFGDSIGWFYVDSIYIQSTTLGPKKTFALSNNDTIGWLYEPIWVEGVGTIYNVREPHNGPTTYGELNCFYRDGVKVYQSEFSLNYGTCEIFAGIKEHDENEQVTIYPNPTLNRVDIFVLTNEEYTVTVFNSIGELLIKTDNASSIDLSMFNDGLYIFNVLIGVNSYSRKVIKR